MQLASVSKLLTCSACALWYSMLVGERERSGAPGIRVFIAGTLFARRFTPQLPSPSCAKTRPS